MIVCHFFFEKGNRHLFLRIEIPMTTKLWGERGSNPHDVTIDGF